MPKTTKSPKPPTTPKPDRGYFFGTGRRKTATARARLYLPNEEVTIAGKKLEKGDVYVNGKPIETYFAGPFPKSFYSEIYRTTNTMSRFITTVIVSGSGPTGQLGATALAISRALVQVDPKFRAILRKKGYMTRDPRMKERKKPGLMGARKQKSSPKR
ncbi:30S ribosomal protein S9 [Candidatus Gottesmanbacteria bacterium RIFCSPHIGHO2_01_FULL_47_48]|uniref:Small ribosomal subunit protein uS9 n=1 Tax=Candidatus Gottesmanbacteria bacterium RIFCSPHIGHO2_01_FULL_47_48 TaxID=1798381 RepID=A0A1F6A2Z0_9BACT|nr:MAG: 30S ribosomal protein S9 [Candidatus Gottesmanbacteria bacterium RIFCSPHIGHO2_01_FULL_47_48]